MVCSRSLAFLMEMIRRAAIVFDRDRRALEYLFGVGQVDAVFLQVGGARGRVEFDRHGFLLLQK
ncbi:hypothetical protein KL86PLE_40359 [uncultured Pleomorphomonas sp.]|uniref:Uncharacterized protein n=1 Tax=uncultured Pleomorphomonas sp. TaxID=442121 RepID=A0A212LG66_9HYPH|nr:hypothetical protein KL86PLE_40359 [uncultured Pleomorphomonas sp.]